jgi:hypothetical protein
MLLCVDYHHLPTRPMMSYIRNYWLWQLHHQYYYPQSDDVVQIQHNSIRATDLEIVRRHHPDREFGVMMTHHHRMLLIVRGEERVAAPSHRPSWRIFSYDTAHLRNLTIFLTYFLRSYKSEGVDVFSSLLVFLKINTNSTPIDNLSILYKLLVNFFTIY